MSFGKCVKCPATATVTVAGVGWCRPHAEGLDQFERELLRCEFCQGGASHTCDYPLRDQRDQPGACLRYLCETHAQPIDFEGLDLHVCPEHADWMIGGAMVNQGTLKPTRASQVRAWLRRKRGGDA